MRILRWLLLLFLTSLASAQFTTVSGTVVDPSGLPYANGTISATLNTTASPTLNGFPYTPPTQPTGLNAAGSFVMQLADNTVLLPAATTWTFKVCSAQGTVQPAGGSGPVCFTVSALTISGTSQSITAQLTAADVPLTAATPTIPIFSSPVTGTSMVTAGTNTVVVGPVSMVTPGANGTYRFVIQLTQTTNGTGGTCAAGSVAVNLSYKDADSGVTYAVGTVLNVGIISLANATITQSAAMANGATGAGNNYTSWPREFRAASGVAITYQVIQNANSNCTTPPVFTTRPALYYMGY